MSNPFEISTSSDKTNDNVSGDTPVTNNATRVSVTLKGSAGYDAPWIVVEAPDLSAVNDALEDSEMVKKAIQNAVYGATAFQEHYATEKERAKEDAPKKPAPASGSEKKSGQPAGSEQPDWAPRVPAHMWVCEHSEGRKPHEGTNRYGKPFWAMFCQQPKGESCEGIFVNNNDLK